MDKQEKDTLYYSTEFAKQVARIRKNPKLLDTKEKLVNFWRLALQERNRNNKVIQEYIATEAARTVGVMTYGLEYGGRPQTDPYQAIILQFAWMDHLDNTYRKDEADKEWDKLANMLEELKGES